MVDNLAEDLAAESSDLDALVAPLPPGSWALPTPARRWSIAHQIAHLAWTDGTALLAMRDPAEFHARIGRAAESPGSFVDEGTLSFLSEPEPLLARWRAGRVELAAALAAAPPTQRIPWFGTSMAPASMMTARIMETWAHGLDVADALGVIREPTARLRHIAFLGVRTLGWSFLAHGRPAPTAPVRVELTAPDGALWTYGPASATDVVTGPALDFCLVITQRRHRADLALVASGPVADEWLDVAQAFAGMPGEKRPPRAESQPAPVSP